MDEVFSHERFSKIFAEIREDLFQLFEGNQNANQIQRYQDFSVLNQLLSLEFRLIFPRRSTETFERTVEAILSLSARNDIYPYVNFYSLVSFQSPADQQLSAQAMAFLNQKLEAFLRTDLLLGDLRHRNFSSEDYESILESLIKMLNTKQFDEAGQRLVQRHLDQVFFPTFRKLNRPVSAKIFYLYLNTVTQLSKQGFDVAGHRERMAEVYAKFCRWGKCREPNDFFKLVLVFRQFSEYLPVGEEELALQYGRISQTFTHHPAQVFGSKKTLEQYLHFLSLHPSLLEKQAKDVARLLGLFEEAVRERGGSRYQVEILELVGRLKVAAGGSPGVVEGLERLGAAVRGGEAQPRMNRNFFDKLKTFDTKEIFEMARSNPEMMRQNFRKFQKFSSFEEFLECCQFWFFHVLFSSESEVSNNGRMLQNFLKHHNAEMFSEFFRENRNNPQRLKEVLSQALQFYKSQFSQHYNKEFSHGFYRTKPIKRVFESSFLKVSQIFFQGAGEPYKMFTGNQQGLDLIVDVFQISCQTLSHYNLDSIPTVDRNMFRVFQQHKDKFSIQQLFQLNIIFLSQNYKEKDVYSHAILQEAIHQLLRQKMNFHLFSSFEDFICHQNITLSGVKQLPLLQLYSQLFDYLGSTGNIKVLNVINQLVLFFQVPLPAEKLRQLIDANEEILPKSSMSYNKTRHAMKFYLNYLKWVEVDLAPRYPPELVREIRELLPKWVEKYMSKTIKSKPFSSNCHQ